MRGVRVQDVYVCNVGGLQWKEKIAREEKGRRKIWDRGKEGEDSRYRTYGLRSPTSLLTRCLPLSLYPSPSVYPSL